MISLEGIDNIIFDLGGVILNIDYELSAKAFRELGASDFDELYSQAKQSNLFDLLETGQISPTKFRDEVRNIFQSNWDDDIIDRAWNAMLLDLPSKRIELLKEIGSKYRIFLLSNTNQIHFEAYTEMLDQTYGLSDLSELFEKAYYSHQIKKRKPHSETFQFVLYDAQIDPAKTIFIDDSIQHIEGAREAGLQAFHHSEGDISDQFNI